MAGQIRNLKVKNGRFHARVAVPVALQSEIGRTELTMPLGGDRRAAMNALPGAVSKLKRQLDAARMGIGGKLSDMRSPVTTHDFGRAVWGFDLPPAGPSV